MARPQAALPTYAPYDERYYNPGGSLYGGDLIPGLAGVGSESAMRLITVQNCVRVRAYTISQLPCHIMEKKGKERNQATDFYLYEILHDQPNEWMSSSEFWGMAEAHVCLRGNFYAYKLGLENRPIQQLIPLKPGAVSKIDQNDDYSLTYHIQFKTGDILPVSGNKIFHLRGLTLDGINGVNPIEYARETIGTGLASVSFIGDYFNKGMHPGAIFKHPLHLNAPAHSNLKKTLKEKYQGLGKNWEMMLIDEGMNVEFPDVKLVDAQFLEQMKMNEAQICGLFRVPLMLIQSGDKAPTYASAEEFSRTFVVYGLTPDIVNYEKAIKRDLLSQNEKKKYYAKFELRGLLRGSFKEQMEGFAIAIDKELVSPNEVREMLDMNPRTDPDGDTYRTRTSTIKQEPGSNGE